MSAASELSQAERLRAQIARMVAGNGPSPDAVVVQSEQTTAIKLLGALDVRLHAKTEPTRGNGNPTARWRQSFETAAEMNTSLAELQTQTLKDAANLQYAAEQILLETNQGWGLTGSGLPISHLNFDVGAKEKCSHCKGEKTGTCKKCDGRRRHECDQCRGRKETQCQACYGQTTLPSGEDCQECRKRGVISCTHCQGIGDIVCHNCGGKGHTPCATCDALGDVWQQIAFHIFAQTNFKMTLDGEYEEDILQHIRRLKPEQLLDGRAVITIGEKTAGDSAMQVAYQAEFPIMQLQLTVADVPAKFVLLGEKAAIIEAAHFMDRLLAPSLDVLRRARTRQIPAVTALADLGKIRFYRDALSPGKKLQELRRRYPFGISANILREVPPALQYLLSILTEQPRMLAAFGFNAVLAMLLLYLIKTNPSPGHLEFLDIAFVMIILFINLMVLMATHFDVTKRTLKSFGLDTDMNGGNIASALGKTGFASLGVSLLLCVLAWALR